MKKIFYTLLLVLGISASLLAQNTLMGSITDKISGEKLIGATIYCPELNKVTVTNADGAYELNIGNGNYKLQITFLGYQTLIETINPQTATGTLNFQLSKSVFEVNEVVISSAVSTLQDESAQEIDVVKAADARKMGAATVMDAVATIPGVSQITSGAYVSRPVIRGLSGNRVLTVSGGVRLENQQWDDEHSLGLSDIGMDRVEVIKGPATLVYGPEAMGGIIHVIEEQPAPVGHTVGDASIGGYANGLGFKGQAGLKGATDKYFWNIRGGGATFADYFDGNNNRVANSRFGEGVGMGTIGINRHWGTSSISYVFNQSFYGVVEANEKPNADGETFPREAESPYHNVTYQKITSNSTFLLGKSKLKTVFAYQNDQRGEYEPDSMNPTNKAGLAYVDLSLQSYTYDVRWEVPTLFKHWDVVVGSQGMAQVNTNNGNTFHIIPDANQNDISAFAAGKLHLGKLAIEQGIRYDQRTIRIEPSVIPENIDPVYDPNYHSTFQNTSGALGFTYDVEEHLLLRANIASGYKAPNLNELLTHGYKLETRRFEFGDAELKHEHNTELDVSAVFKSRHISLEVSAYRNTVCDYIYISPTGSQINNAPVYQYQQGDAILQGLEAGIDIHPASLHGIHLESKGSMMEGKHIDGDYLPFMPANRISNSIIADWKSWEKLDRPYTKVTVINVFDQNKVAANELVTPAYTLVNFALGATLHYKLFPIEISLAANNLLNQVYYDHLSRLRKDGVYNMGTNVALNIRVPFSLK